MSLNDLPDGTTVYLDANIFVYDFTGQSAECATLLLRAKAGDIEAVTGAQVITETVHRLMAIEAVERGLITAGNPARTSVARVALLEAKSGVIIQFPSGVNSPR